VPRLLVGRLSASHRDKAAVPLTADHWLDRLTAQVKAHIDDFRAQRDQLVERTMPPVRLFDHAFNTDERAYLQTGANFIKLYNTVRGKLLHGKRPGERLTDADMATIREQLETFLSRHPDEVHSAILRGALVSTYMSDAPSDAALWQIGGQTEHGHAPGIAQKTLRALREIGILDEIGLDAAGGAMRYPGARISEPTYGRSIGIQGVWFNWYCQQQAAQGKPVPERMSDVPKSEMRTAKARVAELAERGI
jgi:hypothetical protein